MKNKRSLIRMLSRALYASSLVFLIAGLLLSALNSPARASGDGLFGDEPTAQPQDGTETAGSDGDDPSILGDSTGSLLEFTAGCDCACDSVYARVCNTGKGDMSGPVEWSLYYNPDGNPSFGQVVLGGSLGPLAAGQCVDLSYAPFGPGNYAYRLEQEAGSSGPSILWSNGCAVSGACYPDKVTSTPFQPMTHTPTLGTAVAGDNPTVTGTPPSLEITPSPTTSAVAGDNPTPSGTPPSLEITPSPTSSGAAGDNPTPTNTPPGFEITPSPTSAGAGDNPTPTPTPPDIDLTPSATAPAGDQPFDIDFVCGYVADNHLLWRVSNNSTRDVYFRWNVSGTSESGDGFLPAFTSTYIATSLSASTVRLFVDNQLAASADKGGPCKEYLFLSYDCVDEEQFWYARNPNAFSVAYTWTVNGVMGGGGVLAADSVIFLTSTPIGDHTVELFWADAEPGVRSVVLTSSAEECLLKLTVTPTVTATATLPAGDLTPTFTPTLLPSATPSPTATGTLPTVTPIVTSTFTSTPTLVPTNTFTSTPSATPTNTFTSTPTLVPTNTFTSTPSATPTSTFTSTPTATPPTPIVITATNTPTVPVLVVTNTPTSTVTSPAPLFITATNTPTVPVIIVTNTFTSTVTAVPTLLTPQLVQVEVVTNTPTPIVTLAPPAPTTTRTPALIPITGADASDYGQRVRLSLLGSLLINIGLVTLGIALTLSGVQRQWKER